MRLTLILKMIAALMTALRLTYYELDTEAQKRVPTEMKAWIIGETTETFELFSATVEAESNRSDSNEGRILIALTILNRKESGDWPDTITGVIAQSGQFQVYYEGTYKSVGRTDLSDLAIMEAWKWAQEEHPNVIYFNSVGYFPGHTPYAYVDGNYFSLGD